MSPNIPKFKITLGNRKNQRTWNKQQELTWDELAEILTKHHRGMKDGPCFVFSTLREPRRWAKYADEIGLIGLDSDSGYTIEELEAAIKQHDYTAIIYSTHSHMTRETSVKKSEYEKSSKTPEEYLIQEKGYLPRVATGATVTDGPGNEVTFHHEPCQKYRVVIPLARNWQASNYPDQDQAIAAWVDHYHRLIHELGLSFDPACSDPNRLFYLPRHSAGSPYEAKVINGTPCDLWSLPPIEKMKPEPQQAAPKAETSSDDDDKVDVIGTFNRTYSLEGLLEKHGYEQRGNKWLAPNSATGEPGVSIKDGRVFSHHSSDPLFTGDDKKAHDAFGVFTILEHEGNVNAAVKAAAKMLGLQRKKPGKKNTPNTDSGCPLTYIDEETGKRKLCKHKKAAMVLIPHLQDLLYDSVTQQWMQYDRGYWQSITDQHAARIVDQLITKLASDIDYNTSYRAGILDQLSLYLYWDEHKAPGNAIPFKNGVLFLDGKRFEPHKREHYFTWQLPFDYNPMAICQPVQAWLLETTGDAMQVELLRAYLNAILTGRADLHRYLELIGPGGTGKGTFIRLAEAIVGKINVHVSEMKHLENNRFETAKLHNKRLLTITDAEKYSGDVSVLKAITGGDSIRFEEKHKQNGTPFRFPGMVLIAANQDIGSSDYTSGLQRRRITVRFEKVVPAHKRRDLEAEFEPYLAGVINWVLAMPQERVNQLLRDTDQHVKTLAGVSMRTLINTNPIANWAHENLIYFDGISTFVGRKKTNPITREILRADELLYPNYCQWCEQSGYKPLAVNRFVILLKDLLKNQLKLEAVTHKHIRAGSHFGSIGIRKVSTQDSPSPLEAFFGPCCDALVTSGDEPVTDQVMDQTRMVTNVMDFHEDYSGIFPDDSPLSDATQKEVASEVAAEAGVSTEKNTETFEKSQKYVTSAIEPIYLVTGTSQCVTEAGSTSPGTSREVKCSDCACYAPNAKRPKEQYGKCEGTPSNGFKNQWPFTKHRCEGFKSKVAEVA